MNLTEYLWNTRNIYPPFLIKKFDITWDELAKELTKFDYQIFNNKIEIDPGNDGWFYEVCHKPYNRGKYVPFQNLTEVWRKNQIADMHNSVFAHDEKWIKNFEKHGTVSCENTKVASLYFWIEMDRKDPDGKSNLQKAIKDGLQVKHKLEEIADINKEFVWLFASGNNSVHLLINGQIFGTPTSSQQYCGPNGVWYNLAHKIVGNVRHGSLIDPRSVDRKTLYDAFRDVWGKDPSNYKLDSVYQSLENLDPNIYAVNSLIRQPWSKHESGKSGKVLINDKGDFVYNYQPLNFRNVPPKLLSWWWDCWVEKIKKPKTNIDSSYNNSYIVKEYESVFPEIGHMKPNAKGFVGPFSSPFYLDSNPDVWVNLKTGYMKDFGSREYSLSFEQFLLKKREEL